MLQQTTLNVGLGFRDLLPYIMVVYMDPLG